MLKSTQRIILSYAFSHKVFLHIRFTVISFEKTGFYFVFCWLTLFIFLLTSQRNSVAYMEETNNNFIYWLIKEKRFWPFESETSFFVIFYYLSKTFLNLFPSFISTSISDLKEISLEVGKRRMLYFVTFTFLLKYWKKDSWFKMDSISFSLKQIKDKLSVKLSPQGFGSTVKLGYNELGCWRTLGYNEHIFE